MDTYITLRSGSVQTQQPKEDKIAASLDLTPIVDDPKPVNAIVEKPSDNIPEKDLEYSRENLYHLIERGRDALDGILNLADQSQSPRAYEVAGQIIKTMTDTNPWETIFIFGLMIIVIWIFSYIRKQGR